MNERIKKFERQCWNNQTNHLDAEKFAKLIVQEFQDEIWNRVIIESADSSEKYLIRGVVQSVLYDMNQNFGVNQ
jgi:hypothetical protein